MRNVMKHLVVVLAITVLGVSAGVAQDSKVAEATFKASGNCGQCKTRIEKALRIKEVKFATWDRTSKLVTVAYISSAISLDSLQHRVAAVGHDTEKYTAPAEVYSALPECCRYRQSDKIQ
jgi:hypothetical protein